MEQEQILNEHSPAEGDSSTNTVSQGSVTAHNKQKFPLMHTAGTGTRSITRTAIALFGLFVFVCCRNSGSDTIPTSDTIFGDSVTSGVLENNNADTLLTEVPPPPEWKCKSNGDNVYRVLTDSEIANLSFVAYHKKNWVKSLDETFDRWEEFASVHRPYYSKTTCPRCGHHLLVLYSESPQDYWEALSGRGGYFFVCTHCQEVQDFECSILN